MQHDILNFIQFLVVFVQVFDLLITKFKIYVNAYLSNLLFDKLLSAYQVQHDTTFQGILKEISQVDKAIGSFFQLETILFELLIGFYYLNELIGSTIYVSLKWGIIVSLLSLLSATFAQIFAWRVSYFQDQRLKLTNQVLVSMKQLKCLQWENVLEKRLQKLRDEEFFGNKGIQYVDSFVNFFRRMTSVVLMFVVFYSLSVTPTQFYTTLIFFDRFVAPLNSFPWAFGEFMGSFISFMRLKSYLDQQDYNQAQDTFFKWPTKVVRVKFFDTMIDFFSGRKKSQAQQQEWKLKIQEDFQGKLVMVVGQVGSGKTALLNSLLGEMNGSRRRTENSTSFVSQVPWIFSGTIQENILFGNPLQEDRYQKCLQASDLVNDKMNDSTQVGTHGTNLSGGQKQRVAFARALYNESALYIFDDIFSSVDEQVADTMFLKGIRNYLNDRQIIMTINQLQYLRFADEIIEVSNGIAKKTDGHIQNIGNNQNIQQDDQKNTLNQIATNENIGKTEQIDIYSDENMFMNYSKYLKSMGLSVFLFFLITSLLQQLVKGIFELWTHTYMHSLFEPNIPQPFMIYRNDFQSTFVLYFIVLAILTLLRGFAYSYALLVTAQQIFKKIIDNIMRMQVKQFDNNQASYFIRRLFNDMDLIDDLPLNYFFSVVLDAVAIVVIVTYQNLMMLPCINFCIITSYFLFKVETKFRAQSQQLSSKIIQLYNPNNKDLHTFIGETIKGVATIRAFNKQNFIKRQFNQILLCSYCDTFVATQLEIYLTFHNHLYQNVAMILLILFTILQNQQSALAISYGYLLFGARLLSTCVASWRRILRVNSSLGRIYQVIDCQDIEQIKKGVSQYNEIEFRNVLLNYSLAKGIINSNEKNINNNALEEVSFSIKKWEKVAFCGRTGSGKSSIFNLLVRLYDFQSGDIILNGESIKNITVGDLRSSMNVIPQQGFLMEGSIKENIGHDEEKIKQFLKSHQLDVNISLHVQHDGCNLSSGEKQIINFVQSMMNQEKQIICMDEATSNMDPKTNDKIMEILFKLVKEKTLILISHRLENLQNFDRIYVMSNGKIVEQGSYKELIANPDSHFNSVKAKL